MGPSLFQEPTVDSENRINRGSFIRRNLTPHPHNVKARSPLIKQEAIVSERLLSRIKLGRLAEPADLAGAALFLASPASDFITGHTLFVDGGWHAGG